MKMMGRLGWRNFCSCCNSQRDHKQVRAAEKRQWRRETRKEIDHG